MKTCDDGIDRSYEGPATGGGPAFPTYDEINDCALMGMSLRDWFAGQALSRLASYEFLSPADTYAKMSYALADAMLKERGK